MEASIINALLSDFQGYRKALEQKYDERKELPNEMEILAIVKALKDISVEIAKLSELANKIRKVQQSYE